MDGFRGLGIALRELDKSASPPPTVEELSKWVAALPLTNAEQCQQALLEMQRRYNRSRLGPAPRLAAQQVLDKALHPVVDVIRRYYLNSALSLTEPARRRFFSVQNLFREAAYGYQRLVHDLTEDGRRPPQADQQRAVLVSLHGAVSFLANQIVETYLVYEPDDPQVWGQMYRLYQYAERHGLAEIESKSGVSLGLRFRRIVLLALAHPYNLMHGEALKVYGYLTQWARGCTLASAGSDADLAGQCVVDLGANQAPKCIVTGTIGPNVSEPRVVQMDRLVQAVSERLSSLNAARPGSGASKLAERNLRDLLVRLQRAWAGNHHRAHTRQSKTARIEIAVGISAAHHCLGHGAPFAPEIAEIRIHRRGLGEIKQELSLVDIDAVPWRVDDGAPAWGGGASNGRSSAFEAGSAELDVWHKAYSAPGRGVSEHNASRPRTYTTTHWIQKDESPGGMALTCDNQCRAQAGVGELIAYRNGDDGDLIWRLGTTRWLRVAEQDQFQLGIMHLADTARPLAVRALAGTGSGGDYFRALMVMRGGTPSELHESLVVPAGIYDEGTVLVLNDGEMLRYVRLSKLLEATQSFGQYLWEEAAVPTDEVERIKRVRQA